ncbi:hypothetical protein ACOME3_001609 [Neoechinorhynchus agilis]
MLKKRWSQSADRGTRKHSFPIQTQKLRQRFREIFLRSKKHPIVEEDRLPNAVMRRSCSRQKPPQYRILYSSAVDEFPNEIVKIGRANSMKCEQIFTQAVRNESISSLDLTAKESSVIPFSRVKSCALEIDAEPQIKLSCKDDRMFILREVLDKERLYVTFLKSVLEVLPPNSEQYLPSIPPIQLKVVTKSVERILRLHRDIILPRVEQVIHQWPNGPCPWAPLDRIRNCLDDYACYYGNFQHIRQKSDSPSSLGHNILLPVQQLPRYRLHMNRYMKNLKVAQIAEKVPMHEIDRIKGIYDRLDVLGRELNEIVGPTLGEIINLQERLSSQLLVIQTDRKLLKHGFVLKLNARNTECVVRYIILCNDCFVVCSTTMSPALPERVSDEHKSILGTADMTAPLYVRRYFDLNASNLIYISECRENDGSVSPEEKSARRSFRIWFKSRVIDLQATSAQEAADWIKKFSEQTNAEVIVLKGQQAPLSCDILGLRAPVWHRDHTALACTLCSRRFNVLFRRHHCRVCGAVVCTLCSRNRTKLMYLREENPTGLPEYTDDPHRVCNACYFYLFHGFTWIRTSTFIEKMNERPVTYASF